MIAQAAGEGQVSALAAMVARARRPLCHADQQRRPLPTGSSGLSIAAAATALRFPAKAILLPAARTGRDADSLLIADAGHHQFVETELDGETELRRFGTGRRGEPFAEPNGLALLPAGLAAVRRGRGRHRQPRAARRPARRRCDDDTRSAGRSRRRANGHRTGAGGALAVGRRLVAGDRPARRRRGRGAPAAGRRPARRHASRCSPAPPSRACATARRSTRGWPSRPGWRSTATGSGSSTPRRRRCAGSTADGVVGTAVGEGLFDFGHVDGPAGQARLQHPLGVTLLPDGSVAVLDTYNGAVRRYDPADGEVTTLARSWPSRPGGARRRRAGRRRVGRAPAGAAGPGGRTRRRGAAQRTERPATVLRPGAVGCRCCSRPPPGRKLDERYGPSHSLSP